MKLKLANNPLDSSVTLNDSDLEVLRLAVRDDLIDCVDYSEELERRCLEFFEGELKSIHRGDCICIACSCHKCHAEGLLGFSTLNGLGKHSANKIQTLFEKNPDLTAERCLEELLAYVPHADWDSWEQHAARWKQEADQAAVWLEKYIDQRKLVQPDHELEIIPEFFRLRGDIESQD